MTKAASVHSGGPSVSSRATMIRRFVLFLVTVACVSFFAYRMVVLLGAAPADELTNAASDLLVTALAAVVGVGYFSWTAVLNRSMITFCFGLSESCLVAGAGPLLLRAAKDVNPLLAIVLAIVVGVAWAYSWKEFGSIRRVVHTWTGLR